ncbi:hypothetical protein AYI69_g8919, partial [Smittium culicis]
PSASVQEEVKPRGQQSSDRRSRFLTIEESYRRDSAEGFRLLQPAFHDPKEDWRPQTSLGPPQTQPARGGAKLQNGDTGDNMPHHSQKGLSHVLRSPRCVHAYTSIQELQEVSPLSLERPMLPVTRPIIRAITDPVNVRLSLPRRSCDNVGNEGGVCSKHTLDILQALGACIQGQRREIVYLPIQVYHTPGYDQGSLTRGKKATERCEENVEMSCELYWESPVNVDCTAACSPYASLTSRTKESITVDTEIMDIDSHPGETCHSEPIV